MSSPCAADQLAPPSVVTATSAWSPSATPVLPVKLRPRTSGRFSGVVTLAENLHCWPLPGPPSQGPGLGGSSTTSTDSTHSAALLLEKNLRPSLATKLPSTFPTQL